MELLKNMPHAAKPQGHRIFIVACGLAACMFFCESVFAQENAGQGWSVADSRQRTMGGIAPPVTGSCYGDVRLRESVIGQASGVDGQWKIDMSPFPIWVPKAIVYPRQAVRKKWEGQAIVAAEVLPDGSVGRMGLSKSSGHEILDEAAKSSIKTWQFAYPLESQGELSPQYVDIPVTFKIQNGDAS